MGLLTGGAAALFGELFSAIYSSARVRKITTTHDARGNPRREPTLRTCRAAVDRATERMIGADGYTDTDRGIYILSSTLAGDVDTDCEIEFLDGPHAGTVWKLASPIDQDTAAAYWLCRGVRGKAA